MRTKLTTVLSLIAAVIAMLVAASPASATTSNQASDATPYCVVVAQASQSDPRNPFICYSDYNSYSTDIDLFPNFVATMYTGKSYAGYRLAIVDYHGCLDGSGNHDKYVTDLQGSGFRDNIASSKVYGSNCTGGYAFNYANCSGLLGVRYGYDNNGGYDPDWGTDSNKAASLYIAHI